MSRFGTFSNSLLSRCGAPLTAISLSFGYLTLSPPSSSLCDYKVAMHQRQRCSKLTAVLNDFKLASSARLGNGHFEKYLQAVQGEPRFLFGCIFVSPLVGLHLTTAA